MTLAGHIFLLLLFPSLTVVHSLHLNLIHKYSIHSPLFPGNLTNSEMAQRLYAGDRARARLLRPSLSGLNYSIERLRPNLKGDPSSYMVELTIGTPARRKYHLVMDTGSRILWMQCKPCIHCWKQKVPIFDPGKESSSFDPIPCNHTLCDLSKPGWKCVKGRCHYSIKYTEGSSTEGVLASETLGFASDGPQKEFVRNFIFGCAHDSRDFTLSKEHSGILGLNMNRLSLPSQLSGQIGGRFAYCLSPLTNNAHPPSRLKFGDEAVLKGPQVKTIPFVHVPNEMIYYLALSDVSVANRRLRFKPEDFAVRKEGGHLKGGFIIDTGSTYTIFSNGGPYERISEAFVEYFKPFKLRRTKYSPFEVCYKVPRKGFKGSLPSMTLHFVGGVDYVVQPTNIVEEMEENTICVAITSLPDMSILGVYQQFNYHFSYNVKEMSLSFAPADCSRIA
uniref:Peptidase A1 domain-containing protein n=1 Tax=Ananas comosus var. bracteatus TaxID=296719 RepID=A0A6V7P7M2_ANACO|nr:unnamed protein product [Ananas comosus var. bracteatus]